MTASFGSISHGTLRTEDLLDSFASELEYQVQHNGPWVGEYNQSTRDSFMKLIGEAREIEDFDSEEASELVNELIDALDFFAPQYGYFGANEGDGSDFGYWLSSEWEQSLEDDGGIKVDDLADIPDDFGDSYAAVVSDHGNVTLYACYGGGKVQEIWSIV